MPHGTVVRLKSKTTPFVSHWLCSQNNSGRSQNSPSLTKNGFSTRWHCRNSSYPVWREDLIQTASILVMKETGFLAKKPSLLLFMFAKTLPQDLTVASALLATWALLLSCLSPASKQSSGRGLHSSIDTWLYPRERGNPSRFRPCNTGQFRC